MGVTWFAQQDGSVFADVILTSAQQGPPGLAHGGATATLLDEAMGGAVWMAGYRVASVNLNIDYHKPVPLGQPITVRARVGEQAGKKITASGEIRLGDGTLAVSGTGLYVQAPQLYRGLGADDVATPGGGSGEQDGGQA
jgi:uncharacterized protein (TIGR00369 family)